MINTTKFYGPYLCKDGRKRCIVNGKTISYARYLLEKKLGRKLLSNEEADHIDDDFTNDSINNLQVLSTTDNRKKAIKQRGAKYRFICPICKEKSEIPLRQYKWNQLRQHKQGPFCGRICARTAQTRSGGVVNGSRSGLKIHCPNGT